MARVGFLPSLPPLPAIEEAAKSSDEAGPSGPGREAEPPTSAGEEKEDDRVSDSASPPSTTSDSDVPLEMRTIIHLIKQCRSWQEKYEAVSSWGRNLQAQYNKRSDYLEYVERTFAQRQSSDRGDSLHVQFLVHKLEKILEYSSYWREQYENMEAKNSGLEIERKLLVGVIEDLRADLAIARSYGFARSNNTIGDDITDDRLMVMRLSEDVAHLESEIDTLRDEINELKSGNVDERLPQLEELVKIQENQIHKYRVKMSAFPEMMKVFGSAERIEAYFNISGSRGRARRGRRGRGRVAGRGKSPTIHVPTAEPEKVSSGSSEKNGDAEGGDDVSMQPLFAEKAEDWKTQPSPLVNLGGVAFDSELLKAVEEVEVVKD